MQHSCLLASLRPHFRVARIVRRETRPIPRPRFVRDGLGAETEDGEVKLGIREGRARVRRLGERPRMKDASKHSRRAGAGDRWNSRGLNFASAPARIILHYEKRNVNE